MIISVETPVIKGRWLNHCIESVLAQTSPHWKLALLWDGGDVLSKSILERYHNMNHPQITVYFQDNKGIAHSRHFLTEHTDGEFILTLDDDDVLTPDAIEKFIAAAEKMPWAGIIRARRGFIDEQGNQIDMQDWFPFEQRKYSYGMTRDLYNHSQPNIIRRTDYKRTSGWKGFEEYHFAGADCDIYTKIEEISEIELIDECLYYYRINPKRTSIKIGNSAAGDMWRRIADAAIKRRGLSLKRTNDIQPFNYTKIKPFVPSHDMVDVVVPFWESNEAELSYEFNRPSNQTCGDIFVFNKSYGKNKTYCQALNPLHEPFDRIEIVCSSSGKISGTLEAAFFSDAESLSPIAVAKRKISNTHLVGDFVSMEFEGLEGNNSTSSYIEVIFHPEINNKSTFMLHVWKNRKENMEGSIGYRLLTKFKGGWNGYIKKIREDKTSNLWMRAFKHSPNYSRKRLECCIQSLIDSGISKDSIHVIEKQQSSAANRNEGIQKSSKPFICFSDDDVEIISGNIFEVLLRKLEQYNVDLIGPKIITADGKIFCADPAFDEQLMPSPKGLFEPDNGHYDYSSFVPWLPTTFLITRREVCQSIGGFDENYVGSQHEDVDFCLKARSRGFRCSYVGEVSVKHYNCARNNSFSANYQYFENRWKKHRNLFDSSNMKRINEQKI